MRLCFTGLWRNPDFLKLWIGQTVSLFGSGITVLALPLTAVLVLRASAAQMGVLSALQFAPALVVALPAGVWVDRLPRRLLLIAADLGRALLVGSIPVVAALGLLRIEHLYAVAFLKGSFDVLARVAAGSFLPTLVSREHLVEANGRLAMSQSVASVAGPGLGGALVQALTAPFAIATDALSFVVSAFSLSLIRLREAQGTLGSRRGSGGWQNMWPDIREGFRLLAEHPLLRPLTLAQSLANIGSAGLGTIQILFITRELRVAPAVLGALLGAGSLGALVGAVLASWAGRRLGVGPALIGALLVTSAAHLVIAATAGPAERVMGMLLAALLLLQASMPVAEVNGATLRQAVTPDQLLGRMSATTRFLFRGTAPLGALLAGALADAIGLRTTYALLVVGYLGAVLGLCTSPVRRVREVSAIVT